MESRRMTAVKSRIADITKGTFTKGEGLNPSTVITTKGRRISRVRVMATVVDKFISEDKSFSVLTLDDATDTIKAWAFKSNILEEFKKGDIVDIVAKIKQYQEDVYILPELVAKINDPNLELLRELELRKEEKIFEEKRKIIFDYQSQVADLDELKKTLQLQFNIEPEEVDDIMQSSPPVETEAVYKEKILDLIAQLDKGAGCDYTELLAAAGMKEEIVDSIINELFAEGACFEPRPGKIKRL